jgi:Flp pilus assembly protein TadG
MLNLPKLRMLRRFRREERGLAALEFALILPVLITMLFGMGELSLAVFARADVTQIASTVADLVAQEQAVSSGDLSNVYNAASMILYPNTGRPSIRVSSVIYDTVSRSNYTGKVGWSCAQNGNASFASGPSSGGRTNNSNFTVPASPDTSITTGPLSSGGSVLLVEVAYSYSTPTMMLITGPKVMTDTFYTKPRRVGQITAPSSCP